MIEGEQEYKKNRTRENLYSLVGSLTIKSPFGRADKSTDLQK